MTLFVVEDELHAERVGTFHSRADAVSELTRRAQLGWNDLENRAPCTSWQTCGRHYEIVEYDETHKPYWAELRRSLVLELEESETKWHDTLL